MDFMGRAAELAKRGVERGEGDPFGAVVVHEGRIVGESCNRVLATNDPTAHAEMLHQDQFPGQHHAERRRKHR